MFKKYRYKIIYEPVTERYRVYEDQGLIFYEWFYSTSFVDRKDAEDYINILKEKPKEWYYS